MKALIKSAAAIAMLAFTAPAFAGGVTVAENGDSKLKFESLLYLNTFADKNDVTTAAGTASTKTMGLSVDRAYFTLKYSFNSDWSMRFTTDMGHEATLGKKQSIYLKYAYLEGKLAGDAAVLRLGQSHTPWIDYEQDLWGHRYVSKTMVDQYGFDTSSDLGVGLKGKLADGMLAYWLTETNGTGYGNGAMSNGVDFDSRISVYPIEGLTIDAQFRDGYHGTKVAAGATNAAGVKSTFYQGMITYGAEKQFRVGANYLYSKDKAKSATASSRHGGYITSGLITAAVNDEVKSTGYDVWAWGQFPGTDFGAFGRFERLDNQLTTGGIAGTKEKITRYVVGLEYTGVKGTRFSLVADNTKATNVGGNIANTSKDVRYGLYTQVSM